MMTGLPMLMYYLWICLWFYDGQLVYPKSIESIQPFFQEMRAHVRDVRSIQFPPIFFVTNSVPTTGCKPQPLRVGGLLWADCLRTLSRFGHAWLQAGRPSNPVSGLQDPHVQLQRSRMRLHDLRYRCRPALLQHPPSNRNYRQLRSHHDRRDMGLCRQFRHVLLGRRDGECDADVWQLHLCCLHGRGVEPENLLGRLEDVAGGQDSLGHCVLFVYFWRVQAIRTVWLRDSGMLL